MAARPPSRSTRPALEVRIVPDAPAPPARACCASRAQVYPRPVVARPVHERARPAHQPGLPRRPGRADGRRLRRADARRPTTATSPPSPSTRRGTATRSAPGCCSTLARRGHRAGCHAASRSRCASSNERRAGALPAVRLRPGRHPQELLRRDQRGRARDVGPRRRQRRVRRSGSTRIEAGVPGTTDRRGAATGDERRRRPARRSSASRRRATRRRPRSSSTAHDVLSSVVSSQVDLHARFGGVVPEIASRAHVELLTPVVAEALVEAGVDDGDIDAVAATVGPGLVGSLLVGRQRGQGAGAGVGRAVRRRQPPRGPPLRRVPRGARPRAAARRAARVGRPHDARRAWRATAATGCSARPSTTPPARRSTRSPATSASATRAGRPSTASRWRATPTAIAFPRAMLDDGLRLLLQRAQDVGGQPRPQAPRRRRPPTWPPRSRRRWSTCSSPRPGGPPREIGAKGAVPRRRRGGQLAAAGAVPRRLRRGRPPRLPAQPGDVHRQRGDGGRRRLVAAAVRRPDAPRRRRRPEPAPARRRLRPRRELWQSTVASASRRAYR